MLRIWKFFAVKWLFLLKFESARIMKDNLDAPASHTEELTKEISSSGGDKELVSPEHEEYHAES